MSAAGCTIGLLVGALILTIIAGTKLVLRNEALLQQIEELKAQCRREQPS